MVEQLRLQVGEAAEVLSRKKISLAGAICLSNVVIMPSAMYRLKLSSAIDEQIDQNHLNPLTQHQGGRFWTKPNSLEDKSDKVH